MSVLEQALQVLTIEAETILAQRLNRDFCDAFDLLNVSHGRIITMGIGKSGHIAAKAAATFASTGAPSFFVHPAEAGHGDLGMITCDDVLLILSNSGETGEILQLLPALKNLGASLIAITSNAYSTLARAANVHITLQIEKEACPLGLAPTSSTTATLALCDALAVVLMQAKDFQSTDFARSHPLGKLGRRLTLHVCDLMRSDIPQNQPQDTIQAALFELSAKGVGATFIIENEQLLGIFTDGDLRRALQVNQPLNAPLSAVMKSKPLTVSINELAANALQFMQERKISVLPVIENGKVCGVLQLHDLLRAGI